MAVTRSGSFQRRLSIMEYCTEWEGGGGWGGGGSGRSSRRSSLTGEPSDLDFLKLQQEEALLPLKEDLADWLNKLLGIDIDVTNFMDVLDSGVHICRLAKLIHAKAQEAIEDGRVSETLPRTRIRCKENARSGTWFARDNIANFIRWCRDYGVKEECLFETEGLVTHSTTRNFVLCLLELARIGYKYGLEAPCLIAMEKEIDRLEQNSSYGDTSYSDTAYHNTSTNSTTSCVSTPRKSVKDAQSNDVSSVGTSTNGTNGRSSIGTSTVTNGTSNIGTSTNGTTSQTSVGTSTNGVSSQSTGSLTDPVSPSHCSKTQTTSRETGVNTDSSGQGKSTSSVTTMSQPDAETGATLTARTKSVSEGTSTENGHSGREPTTLVNVLKTVSTSPFSVRRSLDVTTRTETVERTPKKSAESKPSTLTSATDGKQGSGVTATLDSLLKKGVSKSLGDMKTGLSSLFALHSAGGTPKKRKSESAGGSRPYGSPRTSTPTHHGVAGTRIPVRIGSPILGTSAHGTSNGTATPPTSRLYRGASSSSINSVGTNNGASTPGTPGTPRRRRRRPSSAGSVCSDTPGGNTSRRQSLSMRSDKSDELDKEVQRISGKCQCPQCYRIDRLSEGKYKIGEKTVFVRLLKGKHVMVRVGGGWDTLDHYLATHDPCRIMEVRRAPSNGNLTAEDDKFLFIQGKYKTS